jgi:ABC-type microcin C transport system permease subunit YejB
VLVGYAIPGFVLGVLLIVLFAGGTFYDWFPLRGLTSRTTGKNCPGLAARSKTTSGTWRCR